MTLFIVAYEKLAWLTHCILWAGKIDSLTKLGKIALYLAGPVAVSLICSPQREGRFFNYHLNWVKRKGHNTVAETITLAYCGYMNCLFLSACNSPWSGWRVLSIHFMEPRSIRVTQFRPPHQTWHCHIVSDSTTSGRHISRQHLAPQDFGNFKYSL